MLEGEGCLIGAVCRTGGIRASVVWIPLGATAPVESDTIIACLSLTFAIETLWFLFSAVCLSVDVDVRL